MQELHQLPVLGEAPRAPWSILAAGCGQGQCQAPSGLAERGPQRGSGKCLTKVSIPGTEASFGGQILHRLGQEMLVLRGFVKAAHTSATVC